MKFNRQNKFTNANPVAVSHTFYYSNTFHVSVTEVKMYRLQFN
jgi:hypothetical protein